MRGVSEEKGDFPGTVYLTPKGIREYENGLVNEELAD